MRSTVVIFIVPRLITSSSDRTVLRVITPGGARRLGKAISIGTSVSTHLAPCNADAANPQTDDGKAILVMVGVAEALGPDFARRVGFGGMGRIVLGLVAKKA